MAYNQNLQIFSWFDIYLSTEAECFLFKIFQGSYGQNTEPLFQYFACIVPSLYFQVSLSPNHTYNLNLICHDIRVQQSIPSSSWRKTEVQEAINCQQFSSQSHRNVFILANQPRFLCQAGRLWPLYGLLTSHSLPLHLLPFLSTVLQVRSTFDWIIALLLDFWLLFLFVLQKDMRFALHSFQAFAKIFHISLSWMCESLFKFDELSNANKGHIRISRCACVNGREHIWKTRILFKRQCVMILSY